MAQQHVVVQFDAFGNTKIDAIGFLGNTCEKATAYVEQALGSTKTSDDKKPEFYSQTTGQTQGLTF